MCAPREGPSLVGAVARWSALRRASLSVTDHGSSCRAGNSGVPRCDRSALPWKARRRFRAGSAGRLADDCDITSSAELARRASLLGANSVTARPTMGAAAAGRRCRDSVARRARHRHHPSGGRTDRGSFPTPIRQRLGGNDPQLRCRINPRRAHCAQMQLAPRNRTRTETAHPASACRVWCGRRR